jgi:isopentenyl diphosphate isomerase/L-lactate dehydrogenase-like FMN-dependent dehydrogenase
VSAPEAPYANFQNEIYLGGMAGQAPELPIGYAALERAAKEKLPREAYDYVAGGAGTESTVRANADALEKWRIVPRMLRDVAQRNLHTEVLDTAMPAPLMVAPIGVQSIVHPDGERATARAAAALGIPFILSTASSATIEDVAEAMGEAPRWFQLYWPANDEIAASFVSRAEAAGYQAIVITLDTMTLAWRPRDLSGAYLPFLQGQGIANFLSDPVFRATLEHSPEDDPQGAIGMWALTFANLGLAWEKLEYLRKQTRLPILLKGILHPDDARSAVEYGMDGVIVSNHGGRQVDGAIGALDALPGVAAAVPDGFPVLFDSGVRSGADVVKALALGARAVLVGRPWVWGLALAGEEGVRHVLRSLLADLDLTLALTGHATSGEVGLLDLAPA